jgi:hypothetical protein
MSERAWRVDDPDADPLAPSSPSALVTIHFLLKALRRRWPVWVGTGCAGMLLGLLWAVASPPASVGTVTLFLSHDPSVAPQQAQSTDLSLLRTRTLAADVVERLGLQIAPEEFQESVAPASASPDVLVLEVEGPDDRSAVARARALADAYLAFRASQIRSQLDALTQGYERRIDALRERAEDVSRQYGAARANDPDGEQELSALLSEQAQLATQIESAQQSIDDAQLKADAVTDSSYILDRASPKPPPSRLLVFLLAGASGLIAGTAAGMGVVLLAALTSTRLWLREDVALALGAPVRVSVGGRRLASWWPGGRVRLSSGSLAVLVDALDREVARPPKTWRPHPADDGNEKRQQATGRFEPTRLALVTVDGARTGEPVIAGLAARLGAEGLDVFVVDLTRSGGLGTAVDRARQQLDPPGSGRPAVVHRPARVPSLDLGPLDLTSSGTREKPPTGAWPGAWHQADVALTLADVDPAVGVEHVSSWADQVVVLVSAGRSGAERLRTTGELVRAAGMRLLFVLMVGADSGDESLGVPDPRSAGWSRNSRRPT